MIVTTEQNASFQASYIPPSDPEYTCERFERCTKVDSDDTFSVKRLPKLFLGVSSDEPSFWEYYCIEMYALHECTHMRIPRVPTLAGVTVIRPSMPPTTAWTGPDYTPQDQACIVTSYVGSQTLRACIQPQDKPMPEGSEQHMHHFGPQLLETACSLHGRMTSSHLSISTDSVMLLDSLQPWDEIRLVDFDCCQSNWEGADVYSDEFQRNVTPMRVCCHYGPPEQVASVIEQRNPTGSQDAVGINGPAADIFSVGAVMYELLTGAKPFGTAYTPDMVWAARSAEACHKDTSVPQDEATRDRARRLDRSFDAHLSSVMQQHEEWRKEYMSGEEGPLLQRVRRYSAQPDAAVDFFREMLSPFPEYRPHINALMHPYLKPHTLQMTQELGRPFSGFDHRFRVPWVKCHGLCPQRRPAPVSGTCGPVVPASSAGSPCSRDSYYSARLRCLGDSYCPANSSPCSRDSYYSSELRCSADSYCSANSSPCSRDSYYSAELRCSADLYCSADSASSELSGTTSTQKGTVRLLASVGNWFKRQVCRKQQPAVHTQAAQPAKLNTGGSRVKAEPSAQRSIHGLQSILFTAPQHPAVQYLPQNRFKLAADQAPPSHDLHLFNDKDSTSAGIKGTPGDALGTSSGDSAASGPPAATTLTRSPQCNGFSAISSTLPQQAAQQAAVSLAQPSLHEPRAQSPTSGVPVAGTKSAGKHVRLASSCKGDEAGLTSSGWDAPRLRWRKRLVSFCAKVSHGLLCVANSGASIFGQ